MKNLSNDIKLFVAKQRLGFLATVCPDGSPNLSPKGLTFVYGDHQIVIGEVRSPGTIRNLDTQPIAELNVVDRNTRKGFRFKGKCEVHSHGQRFDRYIAFLREQGAQSEIRAVIVMNVDRVSPLLSPAYDDGTPEAEVRAHWKQHYEADEA